MNTIRSLAAGCAFAAALLGSWALRDAGRASDIPKSLLETGEPGLPRLAQFGPGGGGHADEIPRKREPFRPRNVKPGGNAEDRGCLAWQAIHDFDGDFKLAAELNLITSDLCLTYDVFEENGVLWILQIIQNTKKRSGPLWAVLHDDGHAAFFAAVQSVQQFGGTVVAVESNGERMLAGTRGEVDPDRNFDIEKHRCKLQPLGPSPEFTRRFLRWRDRIHPIISLRTNAGSVGSSIRQKQPFYTSYAAPRPRFGKRPDNTLVYVASIADPERDPNLVEFVERLNQRGVHVIYEEVSVARNDCSLSNYAALEKIRNYVRIEAVQADVDGLLRVIGEVMALLGAQPIEAYVAPTAVESGPGGRTQGKPGAGDGGPKAKPRPQQQRKQQQQLPKDLSPPN
jgi:hypothetical protein